MRGSVADILLLALLLSATLVEASAENPREDQAETPAAARTESRTMDIDDAVSAMRAGDYAEAYCIMRPLAEAGDANAQFNIGWMYLNGYGLRVNESRALDWWQKAAEQGSTEASFSIGMLYSTGEGAIPKDENLAIDYYLQAAEDGHEDAISMLRSMMLHNEPAMTPRMHAIITQHKSLFGSERQVRARQLNARSGPSSKADIITRLPRGERVLQMKTLGRWAQVYLLQQPHSRQTLWVYEPYLENIAESPAGEVKGRATDERPARPPADVPGQNQPGMEPAGSVAR